MRGFGTYRELERRSRVTRLPGGLRRSGTLGIPWKDSAEFVTLGSISRGMPIRGPNLLFPYCGDYHFTFYPQANVLSIVEKVGLRKLSWSFREDTVFYRCCIDGSFEQWTTPPIRSA